VALTVPDFSSTTTTGCSVTVGADTMDTPISLRLTADQMASWTDDDLTTRLMTLRDALAALLAEGSETQVVITWGQSAGAITLDQIDPV
jgi:hypothetical protein